jgi:hypothetical protein
VRPLHSLSVIGLEAYCVIGPGAPCAVFTAWLWLQRPITQQRDQMGQFTAIHLICGEHGHLYRQGSLAAYLRQQLWCSSFAGRPQRIWQQQHALCSVLRLPVSCCSNWPSRDCTSGPQLHASMTRLQSAAPHGIAAASKHCCIASSRFSTLFHHTNAYGILAAAYMYHFQRPCFHANISSGWSSTVPSSEANPKCCASHKPLHTTAHFAPGWHPSLSSCVAQHPLGC